MNIHNESPNPNPNNSAIIDPAAAEIIAFWQEAGPDKWFAKDPAFDVAFRDRFAGIYCQAVNGALSHWAASPIGTLALTLLLEQYPRNAFRGTPWMYATDAMARLVAEHALALGYWDKVPADLRMFLLLPFGHSERLADQERSVGLAEEMIPESAHNARHHRDVVRSFGRFPHRNAILGRASTAEEQAYLDGGGYSG